MDEMEKRLKSDNWFDRAYVAEHGTSAQRFRLRQDSNSIVRKLARGEMSNFQPRGNGFKSNQNEQPINDVDDYLANDLATSALFGVGLGIVSSLLSGDSSDDSFGFGDSDISDFGGGEDGGGGADF